MTTQQSGTVLSSLVPSALEAALRHAYATPPRAYHHFGHVEEVLEHYASVPTWQDPTAVGLAIVFHDAIYEPGRRDNEQRSAALAEQLITAHLPASPARIPRVRELIMLTARHGSLAQAQLDADAAHFVDCDMAILGAPEPRFDDYERGIAQEYASVPADLYRSGRAQFLEGVLAHPPIFLTSHFQQRFEQAARANLERALRALRG
jgi:predicted metal-dependent HD superfamily phosphohydrolase